MLNRASSLPALGAMVALASMQAVWGAPRSIATGVGTVQAEVSIPNTRRFEFASRVNGHRYLIEVALPFEPPPPQGYGVLYVLDGYKYFASASEIVRAFGNAPAVAVAGIGYPDDPAYLQKILTQRGPLPPYLANLPPAEAAPELERTYDLTLPSSEAELEAQNLTHASRQKSSNVGGLDDFLKIIETEVKPRVAALGRVDPANQALFGHSFGGLAALHALFVEPNAFRTFIIASPSIWWNNKEVLADEYKFATVINAGQATPHILVTMGSEESMPPKYPASWGIDLAGARASSDRARMVENGRELVARLKALHGAPGYVVEDYVVFDKEAHSVAAWSALARGVPFAFPSEIGVDKVADTDNHGR